MCFQPAAINTDEPNIALTLLNCHFFFLFLLFLLMIFISVWIDVCAHYKQRDVENSLFIAPFLMLFTSFIIRTAVSSNDENYKIPTVPCRRSLDDINLLLTHSFEK